MHFDKDINRVHEQIRADAGIIHGDDPASEHADQIAEHRQERHDDHARQHSRHDQIIDGADRHHSQRVDLLGDFHRRNFGGDRRAHSPRANHSDQHRSELAPDCDRDESSDGRLRAESDQLVSGLQREHDSGEHQRQRDDRQRVDAEMRHLRDDVTHTRLMTELFHGVDVEQHERAELFKPSDDERADRRQNFDQHYQGNSSRFLNCSG